MSGKAAYVATVYAHLAAFHLPFMRDLESRGFEVHAYAAPDHCRDELLGAGFVCRDLPFSRRPLTSGNFKALLELAKWMRRERYELVHVHTPNAGVICRLAAAWAGGGKVLYTAHGFHFYSGAPWRNWLLYYPLERLMARFTDVLITINREDYERAARFPVRGKAAYLPGVGVDLGEFAPASAAEAARLRRELGLAPGDFAILCIAELNGNKNQRQLLEALRELRGRAVPAVLLLAGTGGRERHYRQLAEDLGLREAVRFLGYRKDIPQLLQAADVLALSSRREGLPRALLEGLAAGKPLVATDVRGSRDLAVPGHNGYLVPVGDARAAAEALAELYEHPGLRRRMGAASRMLAAEYDLDRVRRELAGIYAEAEGKEKGRGDVRVPARHDAQPLRTGAGEKEGSL
ncbi:MAG: glycosyltransferase family 4 protein [Paenibacillus macerans]|uniref:glycosyltransferase family 4 protein n=1 Tax=Paenibacillus macerans TaxID=44252 RepID=UPI002914BB79|nr:glycosyltransferase family 4 protein [Paenibacillus macerans]MDU7474560.1 glycosyltransferase family 4 protein [Paenibacillus macerans]